MGQSAADGGVPSARLARRRKAAALAMPLLAAALGSCGESTGTDATASRQAGQPAKTHAPIPRAAPPVTTTSAGSAPAIDPETARAAVRRLPGVRAVVWLHRDRLLVMVGGQRYRRADTIDRICRSLEALGDARAVVVDVQDITARDSDEAVALSRGCAPAEDGRAAE